MTNPHPIVQELPTEQDIDGASGARLFTFTAYGKGNSKRFPYNVVNEKVASELARLVGLPVPEVLLYQHRGDWMFFSRAVSTTESGEFMPPGTSTDVLGAVANRPGIIEEMICFDLFVCNNDRNPGNFICDAQKQLWLIDFGNALFYRPRANEGIQAGIERLKAVESDFSTLFDKPYGVLEWCKTWEAMQRSFERIVGIPDYFIENTVRRLPDDLVSAAERDFLVDFLCRRKTHMETIVRDHADLFPQLVIPAKS